MSDQEIEQSLNSVTSNNSGYVSQGALAIRLETSKILEDIELFLRGCKLVVQQDEATGEISTKRVSMGEQKANDLGVQAILNYISVIINPQVVQGNFPSDGKGMCIMYDKYVEEVNIDLVILLVTNCYNWKIKDEDIEGIIDGIMKLVIPFMTRLIDNKERESYDNTIRHTESSNVREGNSGGGLKFFS